MRSDSMLGYTRSGQQNPHHCMQTFGSFIKKKYHSHDNKPIYTCKKVWREDGGRVDEWRHASLWLEQYARHQANLSRGFFTPFAHKYRSTGEVVLNTKELLSQTLEPSIVTKKYNLHRHSCVPDKDMEAVPPVEETTASSESLEEGDGEERSDAGMKKLWQAIKRSRDRILDVKAGKLYDSKLLEEEKPEEDPDEMVLISLSDLDLLSTMHTELSASEDGRGDSAADTEGDTPVVTFSNPEYTEHTEHTDNTEQTEEQIPENPSRAPSVQDSRENHHVHSSMSAPSTSNASKQFDPATETTAMKDRIKRDQMSFLQCIYDIILMLRNMSNRHLRSKKPISRRVLRELKKTYQSRMNQLRFSKLQSRRLSTGDPSLCSLDTSRRDTGRMSIFGPAGLRPQKKSTQFLGGGSKEKEAKTGQTDQPAKKDTLDDLVSSSMQSDLTIGQSQTQMQYSAMRGLTRGNMHPNVLSEFAEERGLPIWLKVAGEKTTSVVDKGKPQQDNRIKIIENAQMNFNKIKKNEAREVENELSRLERERYMKFKVKLACFDDLQPGELVAQRLQKMEKEANFITTCPDVEIPPSKWFEELKERTIAIVGKDDADVNVLLAKVGCYSAMCPKTVSYCKAKLCLLVMSLPAYELLTITMQLALKFVLQKILLGEPKQLIQWISLRKLPFVLTHHPQ